MFTEYLTKWVEAFPIPSIEARHGAPRTLLSDRGSNFLSSLVTEVCLLLNTRKLNTSAYHPACDGLVEGFNNTLAEAISMFVNSEQTDWDVFVPSILFAHRVSPCVSTGDSPFYLLYGREPRLPPDVSLLPPTELSTSVEEHRKRIVSQIETAQAMARNNITRAQQAMKLQYDKKAADAPFVIGQRVWVFTPKPKKGRSKKLLHRWHGPFRVCRQYSPVNFQLRTCDNRLNATTVHANRTKHFYDPADRPIHPPQEDDPNEPYLDESDLPTNSFVPDDSNSITNMNEKDAPISGEPSTSTTVPSPDQPTDSNVYAAEKITDFKIQKRGCR